MTERIEVLRSIPAAADVVLVVLLEVEGGFEGLLDEEACRTEGAAVRRLKGEGCVLTLEWEEERTVPPRCGSNPSFVDGNL